MGMELIGRRLTEAEVAAVLDAPERAAELLLGDLDDDDAEMPEPEFDLEKAWHAVHWVLTGTAWEVTEGAGEAVLGGEEVGEDGGYGPARLLRADRVRAVSAALDALADEELAARFHPAAMAAAEVYPVGAWVDGGFAHVRPHVDELRRFYRDAAAKGDAVLLVIT